MAATNIYPPDKDVERRWALAKVYSLLIELAKEIENTPSKSDQDDEEISALLKNNIPTGK